MNYKIFCLRFSGRSAWFLREIKLNEIPVSTVGIILNEDNSKVGQTTLYAEP